MQIFETLEYSRQNSGQSSCQFETTRQFLFNSFIILQCQYIHISINFYLMHFLLWTKGSNQSHKFDPVQCSGKNSRNSPSNVPNNKLYFPEIFHPTSVWLKITPLYSFSSHNIYFGHKKPLKVQTFEIFECSGQNSWNLSSQFWNE